MSPEKILQVELEKYRSALSHLEISFLKKDIPESVYNERKENLKPLIQQFMDAVETLKIFAK